MPVLPEEPPGRIGDLDDRLVLLLVGDDRRAVSDEEGVVGEVEAAARRRLALRWVGPDDPVRIVEEEEPVIPSVRDEELVAEKGRTGTRAPGPSEGSVGLEHLDRCRR